MGKRRNTQLAKIAEDAATSALEKSSLAGTPMATGASNASIGQSFAQLMNLQAGESPALMQQLARMGFNGALGPATPFPPAPLDEGYGPGNRPAPRKWQYNVAENLNINARLTQWNVLATAAVQIDIFARAITIRQGDVTKMDWAFNVSKDAINTIMEDNNCSNAEASKIARELNRQQIVSTSEFWENPYPQSDRGWEEWITEFLWQVLVYDGAPVHPAYTLGGDCIGLDIIDASTIKILLDDYGDFPRPPDPAYQQILWGFPRGEFISSPNKDTTLFLGGEFNITDRDQLSYFVVNRRTNSPYGFSPVEQALQMANIYKEREAWLLAEYVSGTQAGTYIKTEGNEISLENLAGYNRIFNDWLQGSTTNRQLTQLLPAGMEPVFSPTIQEKYKSDYDEDLIKRTCSFFSVDARQFGIVPRAGMGGGKGAAEGEADNAETVSSKPQNKRLEQFINIMSRRYLGTNRMITFTLKDDEGSEDEVEIATAMTSFSGSGLKTLNDGRAELGLPLYDIPEADVPFLSTPNGPVYFTGTLDAQLNPPTPTIIQGAPSDLNQPAIQGSGDNNNGDGLGDEGAQARSESKEGAQGGSKQGGSEGSKTEADVAPKTKTGKAALGEDDDLEPMDAAELITAELKSYNKFLVKRKKMGTWRDFTFKHVDIDQAGILNFEGRTLVEGGLAPRPKSSITAKRKAEDEPSYHKLTGLAQAHAAFIRSAITAGTTGVLAAVEHAARMQAETPEASLSSVAAHAISQNVNFDNTQAVSMLGNLYRDAGKLGTDTASEATDVAGVASRSVQELLGQRNIVLNGINQSAMKRMSDTIASGLANGDSHGTIADAVNAIIDDPARSDVIAITEGNRSYNAAFVDQLKAAGETQFDWVNEADPCPECEAEIDANPHDINDDAPPEHPSCRCVAVMVSAANEEAA